MSSENNDHLSDIVYDITENDEKIERHTLAVVVDNEFGVLGRVVGLFSGRGYNIESLTVAETNEEEKRSRITLVTCGTKQVVTQIIALLDKMVPVHKVYDLTENAPHVERELALVKVSGVGEKRVEALRIADIFRARSVDATTDSFVFEITGKPSKIDNFIKLMKELGLIEIARTGSAAMARGNKAL